MDPREEHVYMAKLAEQAERYDEMVEHVSKTYVHNIYIYTHLLYVVLVDWYIYCYYVSLLVGNNDSNLKKIYIGWSDII